MRYLAILVAIGIFSGCKKECVDTRIPACIAAKIGYLKDQPEGNPAYSVYQYTYNGQRVYYFPPQCCDQYSDLFDANCNLICHPDGGITGGGDGGCANFFSQRTNEVLVWKDNR